MRSAHRDHATAFGARRDPEAASAAIEAYQPLGRRPYDLRHAVILLCPDSGVPATEVARDARLPGRARHCVMSRSLYTCSSGLPGAVASLAARYPGRCPVKGVLKEAGAEVGCLACRSNGVLDGFRL